MQIADIQVVLVIKNLLPGNTSFLEEQLLLDVVNYNKPYPTQH